MAGGKYIKAISLLSEKDLANIVAGLPSAEVLRFRAGMPLYDKQTVANAATGISWFGDSGASGLEVTNLNNPGQVPPTVDQVVKAIRLKAIPQVMQSTAAAASYASDHQALFKKGGTTFTIGGRTILTVPALMDLAGGGLDGFAAAYGNNQNIAYSRERNTLNLRMKPWYGLPGTTSIALSTVFGTAVSLASSVDVVAYLDGDQFDAS